MQLYIMKHRVSVSEKMAIFSKMTKNTFYFNFNFKFFLYEKQKNNFVFAKIFAKLAL